MILHSSIKKLKDTAGKNYWQQRVSAELLFLYNLSAAGVGIDTALLMCAAEKLTAALSENGAVTKADVIAAEKALAPLSDVAKSYTAHMVAHAHIDMNWMWGYQETASVTLSTLRTMLDLMKAYPDFTFSQSQASVYEIVEHHDKEMLEEIKERIREGRWEVTAGTWVEHDKNLSGAEAQIRQVTEARKYLSALLDVSPDSLDLDFEPDTFGHPADTVELLTSAGIKYYYHCRGESGHILYRWVGESGESLLVYRDPKWYNDDIDPYILSDMPLKICPLGITDMLNVYGVGDHGGGPTVKDIKAILDMREWPLYPDMVFSSYRGFFGTVEKNAESLPTVRGELNFIFTGCYTSQSEIKKANATLEDRLYDSECAFSLAGICSDRKADGKGFEKAWRAALFNQFHDILPGSGVRETREHALGAFQEALAYVNSEELAAIRAVSDMTDTDGLSDGDAFPLGAGAGYFSAPDRGYLSADAPYGGRVRIVQLFNTTSLWRKETAKIVLFDLEGELSLLRVKNSAGEDVPFTVESSGHHYWRHYATTLLIDADVPPFGYETYTVSFEDRDTHTSFRADVNPRLHSFGDREIILENELIRAVFEPVSYALTSVTDKRTGEEIIKGGTFNLAYESLRRGESSWAIGQYMQVKDLCRSYKTKFLDFVKNGHQSSVSYEIYFEKSRITVTHTLKKGSCVIDCSARLDWLEAELVPGSVPQLSFALKTAKDSERFTYAAPLAPVVRDNTIHDMPSLGFVLGGGAAILCPHKYGYRGSGDTLSLTLIRSSCDPDPYPELGRHDIFFSYGAVRTAEEAEDILLALRHPLILHNAAPHKGTLSKKHSFFEVSGARVLSVKPSDDKEATVIRLMPKEEEVMLTFCTDIKSALLCSADEAKAKKADFENNTLRLYRNEKKPVTLKISLQTDKCRKRGTK